MLIFSPEALPRRVKGENPPGLAPTKLRLSTPCNPEKAVELSARDSGRRGGWGHPGVHRDPASLVLHQQQCAGGAPATSLLHVSQPQCARLQQLRHPPGIRAGAVERYRAAPPVLACLAAPASRRTSTTKRLRRWINRTGCKGHGKGTKTRPECVLRDSRPHDRS